MTLYNIVILYSNRCSKTFISIFTVCISKSSEEIILVLNKRGFDYLVMNVYFVIGQTAFSG